MKRVVIFDDSRTVRLFVRMALEENGYQVEAHEDPSGFSPDEQQPPDLVLVDVNMDEYFGTDLVAHFRHNWPGHPLIYLYSDLSELELQKRVKACKADGYISKSWGFDGLVESVEAVIGEPAAEH